MRIWKFSETGRTFKRNGSIAGGDDVLHFEDHDRERAHRNHVPPIKKAVVYAQPLPLEPIAMGLYSQSPTTHT